MALAFLGAGLGRRPRDEAALSLGLLTLLMAAATASLLAFHAARCRGSGEFGVGLSFAVASLTAFVPVAWYAGIAAKRQGEGLMEPAYIFLMIAVLFVANRYDAMVAAGTFDTVYVQPFAFVGFATAVSIGGVRHAVAGERAYAEVSTVNSITRLVVAAADLPSAVTPVLGLVGPLVGADAAMVVLRDTGSARSRYSWQAPGADRRLPPGAIDHAAELAALPAAPARQALRVETVDDATVVAAPVIGGGRFWGTFLLVSPEPPAALRARRRLIELIAAELAGLIRRMRHITKLRDVAAAEERNRIARELHDSVSQTLYSIAMVADSFTDTENDRDALQSRARQIRSMTLAATDEIRVLLLEMRDPALESASLGGLLEQLAASTLDRPAVVVDLDVSGEADLPHDVKVAGFRVAREAVNNATRHATGSHVRVTLEQRAGAITLQIVDDGEGFDPGTVGPGRHGLRIMRERAAQVGATLVIDSTPGQGTRVQFSWALPVVPAARGEDT